ncbi:MAG: dUTP diphosphatase [Ruminococcaceae bacterium]|nr:dUTP diphosphatase [Oscillospiraceae bacterium]
MAEVRFIKLESNAIVPTYGTDYAAGADLYTLPGDKIEVKSGETVMIHTGIAMEIPEGTAAFIFARSGIATKRGLAPANKVGVIDSDYRGEIMVPIHNHSGQTQCIQGGERVAQMIIMPYVKAEFIESESLDETERDTKGFGSTGTN